MAGTPEAAPTGTANEIAAPCGGQNEAPEVTQETTSSVRSHCLILAITLDGRKTPLSGFFRGILHEIPHQTIHNVTALFLKTVIVTPTHFYMFWFLL